MPGKENFEGGASAPPSLSRGKVSTLLPTHGQQVEEGQHRRKSSSDVRESRGGQDPPGASCLCARQYPVACQQSVGAGGSIDLDWQRDPMEQQNPEEQQDGDVDQ